MSFQSNGTDLSRHAATDLSGSQFRIVKGVAGGVALSGAGERSFGILQNKPAAGQAGTVRVGGVSKVVAGGAVAQGAAITSDPTGRAITATLARTKTDDAGAAVDPLIGSYVLGEAIEAAANAGDLIAVLITHAGAVPTTPA